MVIREKPPNIACTGFVGFARQIELILAFRFTAIITLSKSPPRAGTPTKYAGAKNVRIIDSPYRGAENEHEGELKEHTYDGEFCTRAVIGIE
jgi:hypothetical protein